MQEKGDPRHLTVEEVLALPVMREAIVLAGRGGLAAEVMRMNMMEVPDVLPWVRSGELLVSSGYPMQDFSDEQLLELLVGLKHRGVVALVVKIGGRYISELSPRVSQLADQLDLPVVGMPLGLAFTDLQETYFSEMIDRHRAALEAHERVREFGENLRQLLNERSTSSEEELAVVFDALGAGTEKSVHVCVVRADGSQTLRAYQALCDELSDALQAEGSGVLTFPYADHIALVVPGSSAVLVTDVLERVLAGLPARWSNVRCGVGNHAEALVEWRRSFGQATRALQVTAGEPGSVRGRVVWFAKTGVHQLVDALVSQGLAPVFVQNALGPLEGDQESLDTLRVLLKNNCSIARTADEMTYHYNTIRNRMARLESALGPFAGSGHRRAELLLACEAQRRLSRDPSRR